MNNFVELNNNELIEIDGGAGWDNIFIGIGAIGGAFVAIGAAPVLGIAATIGVAASLIGGQITTAVGVA